MLEFDHVIFAVRDFDDFAGRLRSDHGLGSAPGGAHPGHGTGNRIVPLGADYIELMSVVDAEEAAASPLGRWVTERVASGEGPAALCLRSDDITRQHAALALPGRCISRTGMYTDSRHCRRMHSHPLGNKSSNNPTQHITHTRRRHTRVTGSTNQRRFSFSVDNRSRTF